MEKLDIRWYKGKYRVTVLLKAKGKWLVQALLPIPELELTYYDVFTTIPRMLWAHQK